MIWHIFKKDWKLLWPLALGVALVHVIASALALVVDHDTQPSGGLRALAGLFPVFALLGSVIVAVAVIHTDAIPGDREDWLARPIRRTDLLLAKLLFMALAVLAPVFLINTAGALAYGFALAPSAGTALTRNVEFLCMFILPAAILGAVTRNAMEAAVGCVIAVAVAGMYTWSLNVGGLRIPLAGSGYVWWISAAHAALAVLAALIILPRQYLRRFTASSRVLAAVCVTAGLLVLLMPWDAATSAQHILTPNAVSDDAITLAFDPSQPRARQFPRLAGETAAAALFNIPLKAEGIPAGQVLFADRAEIRLIRDGKVLYHQASALFAENVEARALTQTQIRAADGPAQGYQALLLPRSIVDQVRGQDLTLEIDYALSLLKPDATAVVPALVNGRQVADIGWCKVRFGGLSDGAGLRCLAAGPAPSCVGARVENGTTGQRERDGVVCTPDYSPTLRFYPDGLARFGLAISAGAIPLDDARVTLTTYQPAAHFTRRLQIPSIRLQDWEANPAA